MNSLTEKKLFYIFINEPIRIYGVKTNYFPSRTGSESLIWISLTGVENSFGIIKPNNIL